MAQRVLPTQCYCLASRRASRHLTRLYDRHLSAAGMNSSQYSLLTFLQYSPDITIAELADDMVMERTTLVRALQQMQRLGWVARKPPPRGHAHTFSLTPEGAAKLTEAFPMWAIAKEHFEAEFGQDRARSMRTMLLTLPALPLTDG